MVYKSWEMQGHEKEMTFGLNRVNFGNRTFNPTIGIFDRVDRFSEKYLNLSGYQYAGNNPIGFVDVKGDSAWPIKNQWNQNFINQFVNQLPYYVQKAENRGDKCTCDDLGLSLMYQSGGKSLAFRRRL